jgi:Na+/H+ antiporter NhaA
MASVCAPVVSPCYFLQLLEWPAFADVALQSVTKLAVLLASTVSAVLGTALLYYTSDAYAQSGEMETAVALNP